VSHKINKDPKKYGGRGKNSNYDSIADANSVDLEKPKNPENPEKSNRTSKLPAQKMTLMDELKEKQKKMNQAREEGQTAFNSAADKQQGKVSSPEKVSQNPTSKSEAQFVRDGIQAQFRKRNTEVEDEDDDDWDNQDNKRKEDECKEHKEDEKGKQGKEGDSDSDSEKTDIDESMATLRLEE